MQYGYLVCRHVLLSYTMHGREQKLYCYLYRNLIPSTMKTCIQLQLRWDLYKTKSKE